MIRSLPQLQAMAAQQHEKMVQTKRVLICAGTGCLASGSQKVYDRFQRALAAENGVAAVQMTEGCACGHEVNSVAIKKSGCHGFCEMGPLVRIEPEGILYCKVTADDVADIVKDTLLHGNIVQRLVYTNGNGNPDSDNAQAPVAANGVAATSATPNGQAAVNPRSYVIQDDIPFYARQTRFTLGNCGHIDPDDITEYIAVGGYVGLARALLEMEPQQVVDAVIESGLRGRGGGGFPTGRKWQFTRNETDPVKYVVCNGDEGDPGAFMDRSVMEGDPHRVIEGMVIAGYAVGAAAGYVYVRAEYPLAVQRLKRATQQARAHGLLGDDIMGSGFNFDIHIMEGAGAFVCGEESALIASIEGRRGMPVPKPPFPAEKGLWQKPTVINNVETFAAVAGILAHGADEFRRHGVQASPGTKTFALTGDIANTGLIEVPMGMTLREVIFDIGGGIRDGHKFKAVQIGGPSGGCLTADHLDLPLDYDALQSVGAMIGSGGLVVMDEHTCMVDVARFFMGFTQNESCGKCVLCREGTRRMLEILDKITGGHGTMDDIELLEQLADTVGDGSLCGLGKTAPNPVHTTLHYFRDEYIAHVNGSCPAGVCQAFKKVVIDPELCRGCTLCAKKCPVGAISGERKQPFVIDQDLCTRCGVCIDTCRLKAIKEVAV